MIELDGVAVGGLIPFFCELTKGLDEWIALVIMARWGKYVGLRKVVWLKVLFEVGVRNAWAYHCPL